MVIFNPNLQEKQVKEQVTLIKNQIESYKGKLLTEDYWGMKDLAYEMNKELQGYYDVLVLELEADKVNEFTKWINLEMTSLLRHLLSKVNN